MTDIWFPGIPDGWKSIPFARVLAGNDGGYWGNEPTGEGDMPVLRSTEQDALGRWVIADPAMRSLSSADRLRGALMVGDLLMTKSSGSHTHIGKTTLVDEAVADLGASYSNFMQRLRLSPAGLPRFYWYVLLSDEFRRQIHINSTTSTGLFNLGASLISSMYVPLPPLKTQRRIAQFLDHETGEIDAFIANQERLVDLLAERKASLIAHVVAGANQPGARRSSMVGWVASAPARWDEGNIRRFSLMRTGHTPSRSQPEYWEDCKIPWFTLADVWQLRAGHRELGETKDMISEVGLANSAAELLPAGTVVLSRTASVGFSGVMPRPMATSQDFWNWICGPRLRPNYLWYQFQAMQPYLRGLMYGSTHKTIYQGDAASIRILVPLLPDQDEIVATLDHEVAELDAAIQDAREAIALSKERRAALISAVVTGQIAIPAAT